MSNKSGKATEIILNGQVIDWDDADVEMVEVTKEQADALETAGEPVTEFMGKMMHIKDSKPADGTIQLQPKSDMMGRAAARGGHLNYGLSGYFKAYVWEGGKRRNITNLFEILPENLHHFPSQGEKNVTFQKVADHLSHLSGLAAVKVKGGYALPKWISRTQSRR